MGATRLWREGRAHQPSRPATRARLTFVIAAASMPCADNNTICARRQVTTEPELRRTIRSSRLPSSLVSPEPAVPSPLLGEDRN